MIASPDAENDAPNRPGEDKASVDRARLNIEDGETHILALHAEQIVVSRHKIEDSVVRVTTVTQRRDEAIAEELIHERIDVERVPIGRYVDAVPPVREDGDLTIMSVVEEVVVVERRLLLREEIHIRRKRTTEMHTEIVSLRKQEAVITRHPAMPQIVEDDLPIQPTPEQQND